MLKPAVFWIYGLSGAGKTTLSEGIASILTADRVSCLLLDGDELRTGLNKGLSYTIADRSENIRRAAEIAKIACNQGITVLAAFITPMHSMRLNAREIVKPHRFFEVFLDCTFATCANRDVKGLYRDAADGRVADFTGSNSIFEMPASPDLVVNTQDLSVTDALSVLRGFIYAAIK